MRPAVLAGILTGSFNPAGLFASGEKGAIYDPSVISSLLAAPAGSVVSASGDSVGQVSDLSGNGYHLLQSTGANKPLYISSGGQKLIRFDGINDSLSAASVDLSAAKCTIVLAHRYMSTSTVAVVAEHGTGATANPGFGLFENNGASGVFGGGLDSSPSQYLFNNTPANYLTAPKNIVSTFVFDYGAATNSNRIKIRVDGFQVAVANVGVLGTLTSNSMAVRTLFLGMRAGSSLPSNADVFGMIIINRQLTDDEIVQAEQWCAARSGAAMPVSLSELIFSDTGSVVSKSGYNLTSTAAHADFTTSATILKVSAYSTIYASFPAYSALGVYVNGAWNQEILYGASGAGEAVISLPAGAKTVSIVNGLQSRPLSYNPPIGTFVTGISANAAMIAVSGTSDDRLLIYGDSIAVGGNATVAGKDAWALLVRVARAGKSTALEAWGFRALADDCSTSPAIAAFVATVQTYAPAKLWIAIGTNDYGLAPWSAASFGTAYAAMLDALHAAMPSLIIYCQTPILRAVETANGFGSTLGDYRTQIANAQSSRSAWANLVDGTTFVSLVNLADGIHPTTAGHATYATAVIAAGV